MSISGIIQQSNPYEKIIQQLVELESQRKLKLEVQQESYSKQKSALGKVSASISEFITNIKELTEESNNSFTPFSSSVSDESVVSIDSFDGIEKNQQFNITINRLASHDTRLTDLYMAEETTLADDSLAAGFATSSITIQAGGESRTISVDVQKEDADGTLVSKTNKELLESFRTAVNEAFTDGEVSANLFTVNSDEVQLTLKSSETGYDNRIQLSGANGFLAEITSNDAETGMKAMVDDLQHLDAEFIIDGITFTRGTNMVDDAMEGLSFTLLKATGEQEQMTISRDVEKAVSNIEGFIESFNNMNDTIRQNTFVNGETGSRGPLQTMRSIRNLSMNLRQTAITGMAGTTEGQLSYLAEIGIGFEKNGTMKIEDQSLLEEMLSERPDEVAELFMNENSPITLMQEQAEMYTNGKSGVINSLENGLDQKIDRLDVRISAQVRYLEQYEQQQRQKFTQLQQIIDRGNQQFNQVLAYQSRLGFN